MVNVNTTNVMVNVGSKDSTILPPKPHFMVVVYSTHSTAGYTIKEWMTLNDAIFFANLNTDAFRIAFTLPNGERCWLERQNPNWMMRLLGFQTKWVYQVPFSD